MTGTPNQIEWAEQIRPRVDAEFARVATAFREVAARQSGQAAADTLALIHIVEEKRAEALAHDEAAYYIRDWQELSDQVRRLIGADPRFADIDVRAAHTTECRAALAEAFATRTLAEWRAAFADERFPWEPYQSVTELADDPQVIANRYLADLATPDGACTLPTGAVQVDGRPPSLRRAPGHGEHTDEILAGLGHDWDDVVGWKTSGVVT